MLIPAPEKHSRTTRRQAPYSNIASTAAWNSIPQRIQSLIDMDPFRSRLYRSSGLVFAQRHAVHAAQVHSDANIDIGRTDEETMTAAANGELT